MWSHLWLAMPVVGLGLFFVLPFSWALILYLAVVLLSSVIYYKIMERKHAPTTMGAEALIGQIVTTDANGCTFISQGIEVALINGINESALTGLSVYPNPAENTLYVSLQSTSDARVAIIDFNGTDFRTVTT